MRRTHSFKNRPWSLRERLYNESSTINDGLSVRLRICVGAPLMTTQSIYLSHLRYVHSSDYCGYRSVLSLDIFRNVRPLTRNVKKAFKNAMAGPGFPSEARLFRAYGGWRSPEGVIQGAHTLLAFAIQMIAARSSACRTRYLGGVTHHERWLHCFHAYSEEDPQIGRLVACTIPRCVYCCYTQNAYLFPIYF